MKNFFKIIVSRVAISILLCSLIIYPSPAKAQDSLKVVQDTEIENFIQELMAPIFLAANVAPKSVKIYVINNTAANAFVYNGQNIFIHTGLITDADSIDEIVGVLAHELGHITAGHLSRGAITQSTTNTLILMGLAALIIGGASMAGSGGGNGAFDIIGFLAYSAQNIAINRALNYSRAEESQADQIGASYMATTNYSLEGFARFMKKIYAKENKEIYNAPIYTWYATHPLTLTRINFIENFAKQHQTPKTPNIKLIEDFLKIKAKIIAYTLSYKETYLLYGNNSKPDGLYAKAVAEYKQENYKAAISYLDKLLLIENNNLYILEMLGDIYFSEQNYISAIENYNKVKNQNLTDIITIKLARAYYIQNDFTASLKNINIALQINPNSPASWHIKSLILGRINDEGGANLAMAEKYFILQDKRQANYFAERALSYLTPNSTMWLAAKDIISSK
ncbi:M48 family metallopeptidase [Candidatus Hepatincolaceae symbiont of Richtersius coronifer]